MRAAVSGDPPLGGGSRARPWSSYVGLAIAVALVVGPVAWWMLADQRLDQLQSIAAVAELHAAEVTAVRDRLAGDAHLLTTAFPLARSYESWRLQGDLAARDLLVERLDALIADTEFGAMALFDATGTTLWASGEDDVLDLPASIATAWPTGAPSGATVELGLTVTDGGHALVAYATALPTAGDVPAPVVVGQRSLGDLLASERTDWLRTTAPAVRIALLAPLASAIAVVAPTPEPSADAMGAVVVAVEPGADGLFARAFAAEEPGSSPVSGRTHDGPLATGAIAPVGTSGWRVLAYATARDLAWGRWPSAAVAALLAALLYALGLVGLRWLEDRSERAARAATSRADAERDRARALLAAIADASPDAIFAKDLDGRYLFVNRSAAAFLGRDPATVIGRDDRALFPPAQADALRAHERRLVAEGRVSTAEEHLDTADGPKVFLATKGPLRDTEGRAVGTFGVSRDVTEREEAGRVVAEQARALEASLEEVERFNRTLVDRELAMIDLKRRVNELSQRLGVPLPFDLTDFADVVADADA